MNEKFELPHIDKAVGEQPEHQEHFEQYLVKQFMEEGGEKIEDELEKMPRDVEIIQMADKAVTKYLKQYGREKDIKIPLDNIHLLKEGGTEEFTKGRLIRGANAVSLGSIILDREESDINFALLVFHELVHAKSYKAIQVTHKRDVEPFRSGFSVTTRDGKRTYFKDVEEAVIGYMEKKFYNDVLANEESFREEIDNLQQEGREPTFSREEEQKNLNEFIDELYEHNQDIFHSRDEIVDLFIEVQVTGKLLKVARLIEKTFGKGSFRELGEATDRKSDD